MATDKRETLRARLLKLCRDYGDHAGGVTVTIIDKAADDVLALLPVEFFAVVMQKLVGTRIPGEAMRVLCHMAIEAGAEEKPYGLKEVALRTGMARSSVSRGIAVLLEMGLIQGRQDGNKKHLYYRVNPDLSTGQMDRT